MPSFLQQLYKDHERIRELLATYSRHLAELRAGDTLADDTLEFGLARWVEFLDETHHSKEEHAFSRLRQRAPEVIPLVESLARQHNELERHMETVSGAFASLRLYALCDRDSVLDTGQAMLDDYLRHLEWEEETFFPLARQHLQPEDWEQIEKDWADGNHNPWRELAQDAAFVALEERIAHTPPATF